MRAATFSKRVPPAFHSVRRPQRLVVMLAIAAVIAVRITVPFVSVFESAATTFPVAVVEVFPVVARPDPASTRIRRPGPIAAMPSVAPSYGVPVTINPHEFRPWTWRKYGNHARRWRRTNPDSDRHLRV